MSQTVRPRIGTRPMRPYLERATGRFVQVYRGNRWMVVLYEDGTRKRIAKAEFDDEYNYEYEPQW